MDWAESEYDAESGTDGMNAFRYRGCVVVLVGILWASTVALAGEVVLRDSIGVNNTSTNGNWPFGSFRTTPSTWYMSPATVQVNENVVLKEFRAVGAQGSSMLDFNQFDYWLRIWSSEGVNAILS